MYCCIVVCLYRYIVVVLFLRMHQWLCNVVLLYCYNVILLYYCHVALFDPCYIVVLLYCFMVDTLLYYHVGVTLLQCSVYIRLYCNIITLL